MKKVTFLALLILMLSTIACYSADVKFGWDYVNGPDPADGFELRLSNVTNGPAVMTQNCPNLVLYECTVSSVLKGNWFATVRAYTTDVAGKNYSGPSNEVSFSVKGNPSNPTILRIK
jgi:hypothetical protein